MISCMTAQMAHIICTTFVYSGHTLSGSPITSLFLIPCRSPHTHDTLRNTGRERILQRGVLSLASNKAGVLFVYWCHTGYRSMTMVPKSIESIKLDPTMTEFADLKSCSSNPLHLVFKPMPKSMQTVQVVWASLNSICQNGAHKFKQKW